MSGRFLLGAMIGAIVGMVSSYLFVVPSKFWFTGRSEQTERILGYESVSYSKEVLGAYLKSQRRELLEKSAIQDPGLADDKNFWDGFSKDSYEEVRRIFQNDKRNELSLFSDVELFHMLLYLDDRQKLIGRKDAEALFESDQQTRYQTIARLLTNYYERSKSVKNQVPTPANSAQPAPAIVLPPH